MPATDIDAWLENGLQNLQQGQPAFPPDVPITPERVREALRYWRTQHQEWLDNQSR